PKQLLFPRKAAKPDAKTQREPFSFNSLRAFALGFSPLRETRLRRRLLHLELRVRLVGLRLRSLRRSGGWHSEARARQWRHACASSELRLPSSVAPPALHHSNA